MPRVFMLRALASALAVALAGCAGEVGDRITTGGGAGTTARTGAGGAVIAGGAAGAGGQESALPDTEVLLPPGTQMDPGSGKLVAIEPNAAGLRPLVRLTRREYNNTVRDLLGDTSHPADQFPDDLSSDFLFRRADIVAPHDADLLQASAQALANTAIKDVDALAGCTSRDEACARHFVEVFGLRAYRRPLTTSESDRYLALYRKARSTFVLPFADAIGLLLQGMLQSPAFLYHWERAPDAPLRTEGSLVRLDAYELASRLSYFIWASAPDAALLAAAGGGQLESAADLEAEVQRMMQDPKAQTTVSDFFSQLFDVAALPDRPKDPTLYPSYTPALATDMARETAAFVNSVMLEGDGRLETVLSADYSFVNAPLAAIYGASVDGSTLQKQVLDSGQRRGILTQTAFLSANASAEGSHPPRRGRAIYEKLLCRELPPPPMGVPPVPLASAGQTTRERFSGHDAQACASGCHAVIDPIGFAFEHYDAIGRFRTTDNGSTVDSSSVVHLDGADLPVADALELSARLATSATVRACMATQWLRYALGRQDSAADGPSAVQAREGFESRDYRFADLIAAIALSKSFRYRTPSAGEVIQ